MNIYLKEAKKNIDREGVEITFIRITAGQYNINTGSVSSTETTTAIKAYPKKYTATQYNYPSLIGKDTAEWLVCASDLNYKPKAQDVIEYNNVRHVVEIVKDVVARCEIVLYKIITVKG